MALRTRTKDFHKSIYGYTLTRSWSDCSFRSNLNFPSAVISAGNKVCSDHTSAWPYTDGDLDITEKRISAGTVSGVFPKICNGWYWGTVNNHPLFQQYSLADLNTVSLPTKLWGYYTTKALANINPNRPVVDLPLYFFEFKDFPRMLRDLGRVLSGVAKASDIPGGYLAYRFGWRPLVSDLTNLLGLADALAARRKLLSEALGKGGTKVHRTLGVSTFEPKFQSGAQTNTTTTGYGNAVVATTSWRMFGTEKWWYSARLVLKTDIPADDLDTAAFNAVLGGNLPMSTAWNMLPWSWLIDYFYNIGDFIAAHRGYLNYSVERVNLMCKQSVTGRLNVAYLREGFSANPGECHVVYKGRRVVAATPRLVPAPFLSNGQLGILGALITKGALQSISK